MTRGASVHDFGLDVEQDLLRAITGKPKEEALGLSMSGRDALVVAAKTDLDSLPELLTAYAKKSQDQSYRKKYPWVDHLKRVQNKARQIRLDAELEKQIRDRDWTHCWLAVPEIVDWDTFQLAEDFRLPT